MNVSRMSNKGAVDTLIEILVHYYLPPIVLIGGK